MALVSPSLPPSDAPRRVPAAAPSARDEALAALVRRAFGADLSATEMAGGARMRRYFRVTLPDAKTAVAMFVPEGRGSEEVQKADAAASKPTEPSATREPSTRSSPLRPFLEIRALLDQHGVDVPAVFAEDASRGWLLIEDLGDETLANRLRAHPEEREALYRRATRDLARAHQRLDPARLPAACVVAKRAFDFEVLRWEIEHFKEWALDARGRPLAPADLPRWNVIADHVAARVAELPRGFVHRDYHSRNIMVAPRGAQQRLVWIDFQDAVVGPRVYDLVVLLNDSHQRFDRDFIAARLDDYVDVSVAPPDRADERARLAVEFDLVTLQRKLKDAGRFVYMDRREGNGSFLRFVGPTVQRIDGALARLAPRDPLLAELREILARTLGDGDVR